jgi:hypothetical protein
MGVISPGHKTKLTASRRSRFRPGKEKRADLAVRRVEFLSIRAA